MPPTEQEFFAVLQCIDEYIEAQQQLGQALKDGLFNVARGKYALGGALGQQRYPGDMQATSLIQLAQPADEDVVYDGFELQRCTSTRSANGAASSSAKDPQQQEDASGSQPHGHASTDPINWFTALPPAPVRQAQADFNSALQRVVAAANALQRLRQHAADLSITDQEDAASDAS